MLKLLSELCAISAASGNEAPIREKIISEIDGHCDWHIDALGNIIVFKKGKKTPKNKIMLDAHTDEVGVIATYVTDEGFINFLTVGGISTEVLLSRRVVFQNGTLGVIGQKPIHMISKDEGKKTPPIDSLYIDIGCDSKEEVLKHISLGDTAVFDAPITVSGDFVTAKAIDDRAGCAIIIKMIQGEPEYDFYASFSVQEEVGLRGAATAAFAIEPDFAICLEATTAGDIMGVEGAKKVCTLGEGPAVSFMDGTTLYDRELFTRALNCGVKSQVKTAATGGNDSGSIHKSRGGVRTITISVPCRYIHSASCSANIKDVEGAYALAEKMLSIIGGEL